MGAEREILRYRSTGEFTVNLAPRVAFALVISTSSVGFCQFEPAEDSKQGVRFGTQDTTRWQVGMIVTAPPASPVAGIQGTVPVPTDWPEQQVRIVAEDISSQARVRYRTLNNGVKQMVVAIRQLPAGTKARVLVTYEVTTRELLPPEYTDQFVMPKRLPRHLRHYLGGSPYIEVRDRRIRAKALELVKEEKAAWQTVETMYDWVREHVEYRDGQLKGALAALRDKTGDCEELTSLFIALCRVNKIPARTVWVPGHCYPEFYLQDADGNGHWFPCQAAGSRSFGGMPDRKPILQKGDNFNVPGRKKPQRYVAEFLTAKAVRGRGNPDVEFVRRLLPK